VVGCERAAQQNHDGQRVDRRPRQLREPSEQRGAKQRRGRSQLLAAVVGGRIGSDHGIEAGLQVHRRQLYASFDGAGAWRRGGHFGGSNGSNGEPPAPAAPVSQFVRRGSYSAR
jgi:hypothetical protein